MVKDVSRVWGRYRRRWPTLHALHASQRHMHHLDSHHYDNHHHYGLRKNCYAVQGARHRRTVATQSDTELRKCSFARHCVAWREEPTNNNANTGGAQACARCTRHTIFICSSISAVTWSDTQCPNLTGGRRDDTHPPCPTHPHTPPHALPAFILTKFLQELKEIFSLSL